MAEGTVHPHLIKSLQLWGFSALREVNNPAERVQTFSGGFGQKDIFILIYRHFKSRLPAWDEYRTTGAAAAISGNRVLNEDQPE